jgi:hypothetical protein
MSLDGFEQAANVLSPAITVTSDGEFETQLGGVMKARSPMPNILLEKERQAAIFFSDQSTTTAQFRLAEALLRFNHFRKLAVASKDKTGRRSQAGSSSRNNPEIGEQSSIRPRRTGELREEELELSAGDDASIPGVTEMLSAAKVFVTLDDGRQAFRMVWVARMLADDGFALPAAEQLARRAAMVADSVTEPAGSLRDAPLLKDDREGRRALFLGRVEDTLGWTLLKKRDIRGAIQHLTKSVETFRPCQERNNALWHLAVATEESGDEKRALELYIQSYDPASATADLRKNKIGKLYMKVHGTLDGLESLLKK